MFRQYADVGNEMIDVTGMSAQQREQAIQNELNRQQQIRLNRQQPFLQQQAAQQELNRQTNERINNTLNTINNEQRIALENSQQRAEQSGEAERLRQEFKQKIAGFLIAQGMNPVEANNAALGDVNSIANALNRVNIPSDVAYKAAQNNYGALNEYLNLKSQVPSRIANKFFTMPSGERAQYESPEMQQRIREEENYAPTESGRIGQIADTQRLTLPDAETLDVGSRASELAYNLQQQGQSLNQRGQQLANEEAERRGFQTITPSNFHGQPQRQIPPPWLTNLPQSQPIVTPQQQAPIPQNIGPASIPGLQQRPYYLNDPTYRHAYESLIGPFSQMQNQLQQGLGESNVRYVSKPRPRDRVGNVMKHLNEGMYSGTNFDMTPYYNAPWMRRP